jgi:hypothetical protein
MRLGFLLLVFASFLNADAQQCYDNELQLTEIRFALESQIHGLKWGFLHNMDTAALGINNKGFVSLDKVWRDRPDQPSPLLQWKPTALWWSEDGLFGLTTGPFFTQAKDSVTMATGYFFTIWQREHTSKRFKFVVDAGVQMSPGAPPSVFVSAPVVKSIISNKTGGKQQESALAVQRTDPFESFANKAGNQSLLTALKTSTHEKSFVLVSDFGKLSIIDLDTVAALDQKVNFQRTKKKALSTYCYYEWGQFRSAEGGGNYSGYYVHVWQMQHPKSLLLAAVYKFDQAIKP